MDEGDGVTWFKVCDTFHGHPKTEALIDSGHGNAIALWTMAGTWCATHLTDGAVPTSRLKRLGFEQADADALVKVGLWETSETGFQFHDWPEYQPSKEKEEARKRDQRDRKQRSRKGAGHDGGHTVTSANVTGDVTEDVTEDVTGGVTGVVTPPFRSGRDGLSILGNCPESIPGQLTESIAQAYLDVTGQTDLSLIPTDRKPKQLDALSTMASWCGGDVTKLRDELLGLKGSGTWMATQPIHLWAERLGTAPKPEPTAEHPDVAAQHRQDAEAARKGRIKTETHKTTQTPQAMVGGTK